MLPKSKHKEFREILDKAAKDHAAPTAPAMPVTQEPRCAQPVEPNAALVIPKSRSASFALKVKLNRLRQKANKASQKARGAGTHREKVLPKGSFSTEYFALVHTPISIKEAMKSQKGRECLEKEWVKLESKNAWLTDLGREYEDVRSEAARGP